MKTCTKCKVLKELDCFSKSKRNPCGLSSWCKTCSIDAVKHSRLKNRDKYLHYQEEYRKNNKELISLINQEYRLNNKQKIKEKNKNYQKNNAGAINAKTAKRRAVKAERTPQWLTKEDFRLISEFYKEAKQLQKLTGIEYHVDHIIPIQGEKVCGLHVPWNLQVLSASENKSKSNKIVLEQSWT